MNNDEILRPADSVTRRSFMHGAARTLLGLGTMPLLSRLALAADGTAVASAPVLGPATARNVIYLYMSGGMSQIDTFDPKPGADTQGPTGAIGTNVDGIQLSEHFPLLAKQMDKVALINSMTSNQGAHAQGRYLLHTSYELRGTIQHPSFGAWLNKFGGRNNPTLPGHVAIGGSGSITSRGFFESEFAPLPIGDPTKGLAHSQLAKGVDDKTIDRRLARLKKMNAAFRKKFNNDKVKAYDDIYDEAVKLMRSSDLAAFDISQEPDAVRDAYGRDRFGQGCLLARRLVEHDVRFVEVVLDGWDTHNENFEAMEDKCPVLDRALTSLLVDLDTRGLLEETLVVVATEFGRTPEIKIDRNGRDHFPKAFSALLAGGGVRGGMRWGKTDPSGNEVIDDPVSVQDLNATIGSALGLPLDHTVFSPSGRPFTVAHKGKPVRGIFA
ncbi:MAG: DUF1501 domain-containing protein [Planctomycetota bacterium]